jgi:Tfp pilus assembly protein PilN
MAQFNLLPDVKLQYIKTQRVKRTVGVLSILVAGGLLAIFILLLLYVRVAQKQHINALTDDINAAAATLQEKPDLDKVLTIQNQLNSLPALHEQKIISSRLADYLAKLTPNKATISNVEVDFEANTMLLQGNADALRTVNKFIDTIKFTKYKTNTSDAVAANGFSEVVLQNFTVSTAAEGVASEAPATYEIALVFDPIIFAGLKEDQKADPAKPDVVLQVPKIISTRSEVETPNELFVPQPVIDEQPGEGL